jgi:riboflavin kinase/FMN adenylyltransferase
VALGNFDGLHLGHRAVLEAAKTLAKELDAPLAVMTFEPHPRRLFNPTLPILRIVSLAERMRLLQEAGVEHVFLQRFTKDFAATSAQDFIEKILMQQLQVAGIITGDDFCFGHNRSGNRALLQEYADKNAFRYTAITGLKSGGEVCSSTRIRELLATGKMEEVAALLTRPYAITGKVKRGDQRGRQWGFPTANIGMRKMFYPAYGIYAVRLHLLTSDTKRQSEQGEAALAVGHSSGSGGENSPTKTYNAVANFGIRPMYPLDKPLLEVHVLDASPDLYDKTVKVELLHYLRPEAQFESEASLRAQIARDCDDARRYLL